MSILGLDIGTTGTKAIAFDYRGNILSQSYREYQLIHPKSGWSELDTNYILERIKEILKEINKSLKNNPVEAISVSSQGEAVVPIDSEGNALHNITVSFDNRTISQLNWWKNNYNLNDIFKITGLPIHSMYTVNKIMWFMHNMPELHSRVWKYLCVEDFITYKLCGETAIDYSMAGRTMMFDVVNKKWSDKILKETGIDKNLLPEPCESGKLIGYVRKDLSDEVGFKSKVAVVAGGHDQPCSALGSGVIKEGMAMNSIGTVDAICPVLADYKLDDTIFKSQYCCYPHVYPGKYVSLGFNLAGGLLLKWYKNTLCQKEIEEAEDIDVNPYSFILDKASSEPSDVFILPYFEGAGSPILDPEAEGAIVGLTTSTSKEDLTRTVLDSSNYEMRFNIESMEHAGIPIKELRAVGGGARSEKWLQLKSDVFGKKISSLKVSEAASLGAAILAGVGLGRFSSQDEGVEQMVRLSKVYEPDMKEHEKYQSRFEEYVQIYPILKDFLHKNAARKKQGKK